MCEFTRGLVAILGENGSGKSSLFGALKWLLTGENPNFGSKTDNISQYAKDGEPSFASLEFEHAGHIAVVTRHLLPEKEQATLTIDGVEAGRGEKGVTAAIEKLLGVDAKFISRFIIVGQTEIFSFIDDSQTETDKFFQRLFNTAKADKCQDAIGKNLTKISIPELAVTSTELVTLRDEAAKTVETLERDLAALPTMDAFFKRQTDDQLIVQAWEAREKAAADLTAAMARKAQTDVALAKARQECEQHETDLEALDEASQGQEQAITAARTALGHWQSYKSVAKAKEDLQASRESLARRRASNPEPARVTDQEVNDAMAESQRLSQAIVKVRAFVQTFARDGVAECPTCHTPTTQLQSHLEEQKQLLVTLEKKQEAAIALLNLLAQRQAEHRAWEKLNGELDAREQQIAQSETKLHDVTPPALSEDELSQTVTDYDSFQQARKAIAPLAEAAKLRKAQLEGNLSSLEETIQQLNDQIAQAAVSAADAHLAKTRLDELRKQLSNRAVVELNLADARHQLRELEHQYTQTLADERKAGKLRTWVAAAERAREALKNAPRMVAQRNLQKLETSINELLQIFQVNFQVKVAEDGTPTFVAEFYDGRRQVAQRLSIGQKTVLALAFRVAVNAMFAEEIGLLALDEPTASLDQPRIQALAPVLEKLRELSTAKGLQCLLVTHAASLSNLFESAIELEPPELRHATTTG